MSAKKPLYGQIQDYIIEQIRTGRWPEQFQIPTEKELSEQFGVSRITAKTAIVGLVNQGYLFRHRGKGTFVSSKENYEEAISAPDSKSTVSKKLIGFIIPWIEFHYSSVLLSGVESELSKEGYHVIFKRIKNKEMESQAIREFLEIPVDGIIITASQGEHFNDDIIRLALNKYPLVLVEKSMRDIMTNSVYCNTERVGSLMVEYLVKRGFDEFGLVTYPPEFTYGVKERIFGFQASLLEHGKKPLSQDLILSIPTKVFYESDDHIPKDMIAFLEKHSELKAIATVDALLAKYVGMACRKLDRKLTIICVDEPAYSADYLSAEAYVDQSPLEMGKIAAQLIMQSIQEKVEPQKVMIEPKLVEFPLQDTHHLMASSK